MPFTLEEMKRNINVKTLDNICNNQLNPNAPAQCLSAKFVDANNQPILIYFGSRIIEPKERVGYLNTLVNSFTLLLLFRRSLNLKNNIRGGQKSTCKILSPITQILKSKKMD